MMEEVWQEIAPQKQTKDSVSEEATTQEGEVPPPDAEATTPSDEAAPEKQDAPPDVEAVKTKLLIQFLFKTGCRVSEMISIRLTDCEPTKDYIKVRIIGKGKKERKVYIPNELYQDIRHEYRGKVYLFESRTGDQLKRNNVFVQIRLAGRRAGFPHVHPHMLRHARATDLLLEKAVSLKAVSKYLGHASTAITADMYIHDDFAVTEIFSRDRI